MKHFLLVYNRPAGKLLELREFPDEEHDAATQALFAREAQELGNPDVEVVLLTSDSVETLRETHGRYFLTVQELAQRMQDIPSRPRSTSAL